MAGITSPVGLRVIVKVIVALRLSSNKFNRNCCKLASEVLEVHFWGMPCHTKVSGGKFFCF